MSIEQKTVFLVTYEDCFGYLYGLNTRAVFSTKEKAENFAKTKPEVEIAIFEMMIDNPDSVPKLIDIDIETD